MHNFYWFKKTCIRCVLSFWFLLLLSSMDHGLHLPQTTQMIGSANLLSKLKCSSAASLITWIMIHLSSPQLLLDPQSIEKVTISLCNFSGLPHPPPPTAIWPLGKTPQSKIKDDFWGEDYLPLHRVSFWRSSFYISSPLMDTLSIETPSRALMASVSGY